MFVLVHLCSAAVFAGDHQEKQFVSWMRSNSYVFTGNEYFVRMGIYMANARLVSEHNRRGQTYRVCLNEYAHLTPAERSQLFMARSSAAVSVASAQKSAVAAPESIDWREKNVVTGVKNQLNCGSCWAFSTAGVLESLNAQSSELVELSEQSLIDCVSRNLGCNGGDPGYALDYIINSWGGQMPLAADYPYISVQNVCREMSTKVGNLAKWGWVDFYNESDMKEKCAEYGPISTLQKANIWSFLLYSSGIYRDEGCSQLDFDHATIVVGYGSDNGDDFWIVKNSMGTGWGEAGYMRLARNDGNMCGIASRSIFVCKV